MENSHCHKQHSCELCSNYNLNLRRSDHTKIILDILNQRPGFWVSEEYVTSHVKIHVRCHCGKKLKYHTSEIIRIIKEKEAIWVSGGHNC